MSLRRKTGPRGGKRPPRKKTDCRPARLLNDRDRLPARPQPAARFRLRRLAPASLLQEALWVPTTTNPFRPGPRREAEKEKGKEEPGMTRAPPAEGLPPHDHNSA
jgi:hypothetical protein